MLYRTEVREPRAERITCRAVDSAGPSPSPSPSSSPSPIPSTRAIARLGPSLNTDVGRLVPDGENWADTIFIARFAEGNHAGFGNSDSGGPRDKRVVAECCGHFLAGHFSLDDS